MRDDRVLRPVSYVDDLEGVFDSLWLSETRERLEAYMGEQQSGGSTAAESHTGRTPPASPHLREGKLGDGRVQTRHESAPACGQAHTHLLRSTAPRSLTRACRCGQQGCALKRMTRQEPAKRRRTPP